MSRRHSGKIGAWAVIGDISQNLIKHTETSWNRVVEIITRRDNYICRYCGVFDTRGSVDHILPLEKGGTDAIYNLAWVCKRCNSSKGSKTLREWVEFLADSRKEESIKMIHDFLKEYNRIPESLMLSVAQNALALDATLYNAENEIFDKHPEIDRMLDALNGLHEMMLIMQGLPEVMLLAAKRYEELMHFFVADYTKNRSINTMFKLFTDYKRQMDERLKRQHPSLNDEDNEIALTTARDAFAKFIETIDIDLDDDTKRQLKLL